MDNYIRHLSKVPLFSKLEEKELERVAKLTTELTLGAGHRLMTEGAMGREFLIILDGECTVSRGGAEVATLGPGSFAGEMSLLADRPRNATVTAKTDVTLLDVDARAFDALLDEVPELTRKLLDVVAARLANAEAHQVH